MNNSTNLYRSAVLALATAALVGKAALAEDLPQIEASESISNIVVATAQTSQKTEEQSATNNQADDSGVAEAVESVLADSKNELELRISDHKSLILVADL